MRLIVEEKNIKCDGVNCNKLSKFSLDINSYKGLIFLCENCFKQMQSILKRNSQKNEQC